MAKAKNQSRGPRIKIVEVGMRDGLQNESVNLNIETRLELAKRLVESGIQNLEIGAFVSPKWVPQMAGTAELILAFQQQVLKSKAAADKTFHISTLVPNEFGMLEALKSEVTEVAIFTACSESFAHKNINCSIEESFERFKPILKLAKKHKILVRGYLSTCFGCPYEGDVPESRVVQLAHRLYQMGAYEISIGDTIGIANPKKVQSLFKKLKNKIPVQKLAGHFHDTWGLALANTFAAYQLGVKCFDSSIGGLGGCPYAPGATGNVATEDIVNLFEGMGISTDCDLKALVEINRWLSEKMGKTLPSKYSFAEIKKCERIRS